MHVLASRPLLRGALVFMWTTMGYALKHSIGVKFSQRTLASMIFTNGGLITSVRSHRQFQSGGKNRILVMMRSSVNRKLKCFSRKLKISFETGSKQGDGDVVFHTAAVLCHWLYKAAPE